jgi:hypothetical protein
MDHSPISSSPGDVQREARHRNGVGVFILLLFAKPTGGGTMVFTSESNTNPEPVRLFFGVNIPGDGIG